MRPAKNSKLTFVAACVAILACAFSAPHSSIAAPSPQTPKTAPPPPMAITVDPAHSDLHWTLDSTLHTVHGTFAIARGELKINPASGSASGEIVADAKSGQTGNDSRDQKMRQEILETAKFPEITFRVTQIDGFAPTSPKNHLNLHGTFSLHGSPHEMIVPADVEWTGNNWKGTANFAVPFLAWGIKNPGNFLLKVSPNADVTLELSGTSRPAN